MEDDFVVRHQRRLAWIAIIFVGAALLGAILAAGPGVKLFWIWSRSLGILLLTALAAGAGGAGLGFLFGIPRVLTSEAAAVKPAPATSATPPEEPDAQQTQRLLGSNSNLEQVSDWLTKIIVGVGLVEFHKATELLFGFRQFVAEYVPPADVVTPLAASMLLVLGGILGFVWMYLETRLVLSRAFADAEGYLANLLQAWRKSKEKVSQAADELARNGNIEAAKRLLPPEDTGPENDISRMRYSLYEEPPQGFEEVIRISSGLSINPTAIARADYWLFLGCAFGQKFQWQQRTQASDEALASSRDNAFDSLCRCLAINPAYKTQIDWFMHPERSPTPQDDDLAGFAGDPRFEALVR
ncbi:MAG: hypothetical protein E6Q76_02080 [Rhizobium sp.]|nr:MAG: hypothetical protein E6Q76_02080 [Rhizobium sp.]